jgi:uncharacterized lipoprotein YbaY
VSRTRIRILLAAALVLTNLLVLAGPLHAQANMVTGTLVFTDTTKLSSMAVAVITLTDRSQDAAGTIIGQQRIDGATGNDPFAVQFDPATINQKHAYSIYASLIDGTKQWQSIDPIPVITGGPTDGLQVPVVLPTYQTPAQVTGTIALPPATVPTTAAVYYAEILDSTTGRLVSRQVIPAPATLPVPFAVGYDAALVNPAETYVIVGGLVDAPSLWLSTPSTIAPGGTFDLTLAPTTTVIPGGPSPSPAASASAAASETPGTSPGSPPPVTPKPTGSAAATPPPTLAPTPVATATPAPTPTPTPSPSPTPTLAPTASPTPAATASAQPAASAEPSSSPGPITVTGQATYTESWKLTEAAVFTVAVVQVDPNGPSVVAVGEQEITNPGQVPISFSIPLDMSLLVPTNDAFLYATLVDGKEAWTVASGIKVATNGNPTDNVQVPLVFRPDVIEGNVTGAIIDLPPDISSEAWASVALLNTSDDTILGFQSGPIYKGSGAVPFDVPFLIANVDRDKSYVAIGNVFDHDRTFRSQGVGIITQGNPYENVILPVVQIAPSLAPTATPVPVATATAVPVATASPTTSSGGTGGGADPLLIAGVIGLIIVGLIVVAVVIRR